MDRWYILATRLSPHFRIILKCTVKARVASLLGTHEIVHTFVYLAGFNVKTIDFTPGKAGIQKKTNIWVCLKMLCTPKPNGFADHYPYEKWLAIIGNINPTFSGPNPFGDLTIKHGQDNTI